MRVGYFLLLVFPAEVAPEVVQLTMKLLLQTLCICLALGLVTPHHGGQHLQADDPAPPDAPVAIDRCDGMEMDAVALDMDGIPYFFKDGWFFKGFHGKAQMAKDSYLELKDHQHLGHVDAAFRLHQPDHPEHDHMFVFLDDKVFVYENHTLEPGYPKDIKEVFPGIPDHLDAAVECTEEDCKADLIIFFKGDDIYHFNVKDKTVDEKEFSSMPNCTSAFHWLGHYYCFHGHQFSKFDPMTGEVHGKYPKDARSYFMRCPKFADDSDHAERERCSHVHLDAATSDDAGNVYAFRSHHFLYMEGEKMHSDTIESAFKELHSEVDAVFSYEGHMHMIKDNEVFVYKIGEPHTHLEGYPKSLKEEFGLDGPVDAAFICQDHHIAHVIKGQTLYEVDMKATPRVPIKDGPFTLFKYVDAAMCGPDGVRIIVGNHFYHFESLMVMMTAKHVPEQKRVSTELFGCDH